MTKITPTAEQIAAIDAANGDKNLMLTAMAGCAKSTTLGLLAHALPAKSTLFLAFNKSIQLEMEDKLPSFAKCKTFNGLGHGLWRDRCSARLYLYKSKMRKIFSELTAELIPEKAERDKYFKSEHSDTQDMLRSARIRGYVPEGAPNIFRSRISWSALVETFSERPTQLQAQLINAALILGLERALTGEIDFDDQIYLSVCGPVAYDKYDTILVDEAQDLSWANHFMLRKSLKSSGRIICVGDPNQAIYGFRGADTDSMENLEDEFGNFDHLPLSQNFRSDKLILDEVRWLVPDIKAGPQAKPGNVAHIEFWSAAELKSGGVVICRNNAPLFRVAIALLRCGRRPEIEGREILPQLKNIILSLGTNATKTPQALRELTKWRDTKLEKTRRKGYIRDQYECIKLFLDRHDTIQAALNELSRICEMPGEIKLMTGHKSKGREFPVVYFLDRDLIDMEQPQDRNLAYVIGTRAKNALFYIKTKGMEDGEI